MQTSPSKKKNASNVLVRKGKITRGSWFRLAEDSAAPPINLSGVFFPGKRATLTRERTSARLLLTLC